MESIEERLKRIETRYPKLDLDVDVPWMIKTIKLLTKSIEARDRALLAIIEACKAYSESDEQPT